MEIKPKELTVRELCENYMDNNEGGVVAYGGKLDVRPPYQREFVYDSKQQEAVLHTILKGFPLDAFAPLENFACEKINYGHRNHISDDGYDECEPFGQTEV